MGSVAPIDISSTDSEDDFREIDNYRDGSPEIDAVSPMSFRELPSWASSTGHNGLPLNEPSSSKKKTDEISLSKKKSIGKRLGGSSSVSDRNSNKEVGLHDRAKTAAASARYYSSPAMRRVLPASFRNSTSSVPFNNLEENTGENGNHGKQYQYATTSISSSAGNLMAGNFMGGTFTDSLRGTRALPPSFISGRHSLVNVHGGMHDPFHHTGIEGQVGPDESLIFQAVVKDLHQPTLEAKLPDGLLSVSLLRHQKIALAWMLNKESSDLCIGGILADDQGLGKTVSIIALIQMQRYLEAKSKRKSPCNVSIEALNLDADDESTGCIALDEFNPRKESDDVSILPQENYTVRDFKSRRPSAGTLIVCPASILRQWAQEFEEKVSNESSLSVLIYHGGNRTKDPASLAKYDVVLTTYTIVSNEIPKQPLAEDDDEELKDGDQYGLSSNFSEKKRKKSTANKKIKKGKKGKDTSDFSSNCGTLAGVKWSRVVLDESQMIKNHRTIVARACSSIRAKRRWCLSGTPIQNSVDELFSYFRFLRYNPYDKHKEFSSMIKARISRDSFEGYQKLHVILKNILLRRTKGTVINGEPIIDLPPKLVHLKKVEFSSEERVFYNTLEADSKRQFKAYAAAGTVNQNYANILLMLLRLRQACDHPLLVKGLGSEPLGKDSSDMAKILPRDLLVNLLNKLETSLAICLVCRDPPENAVVTMCSHVFCYQCVSDYLTGEDNTCPSPGCKEQLDADVVYSASTLRRCVFDGGDRHSSLPRELCEAKVLKMDYVSTKIKAALEILLSHCKSKGRCYQSNDLPRDDVSPSNSLSLDSERRGAEKAIVFSQWTSMLDLMEISLKNFCISYRRLDGTMSIAARDRAVKDFNTKPEVDVMLMSLKAGNLGLNMVAACRVILLDLWWNPATEDQAVDRAHRIGQTRPVTVSRITITDTVEDRILKLQEKKRDMVASAFGEDGSGGHASRLTIDALRYLFEGSGP